MAAKATDAPVKLKTLADSAMTLADAAIDVRGRTVVDRAGEEIGTVDALMLDEAESKVRFLRVAAGGVFGLGERLFLIPVDAVTRLDEDRVHVDQTRERIVGAPAYDPNLVPDTNDYGGLYGYYGYAPFWAPGYVYQRSPDGTTTVVLFLASGLTNGGADADRGTRADDGGVLEGVPAPVEVTGVVVADGTFTVDELPLRQDVPTILHVANADDRDYRLRIGDLVTPTPLPAGAVTAIEVTTPTDVVYEGRLLAAEEDRTLDAVRVVVAPPSETVR